MGQDDSEFHFEGNGWTVRYGKLEIGETRAVLLDGDHTTRSADQLAPLPRPDPTGRRFSIRLAKAVEVVPGT